MKKGDKYGAHRVIEPKGVLPQAADRIDNTMEIYDNEILVSVKTLNVDSASFTQIEEEAGHDTEKIGRIIMDTVTRRGKQHNPVTGSGGMFMGTIETGRPGAQGHGFHQAGGFYRVAGFPLDDAAGYRKDRRDQAGPGPGGYRRQGDPL